MNVYATNGLIFAHLFKTLESDVASDDVVQTLYDRKLCYDFSQMLYLMSRLYPVYLQ